MNHKIMLRVGSDIYYDADRYQELLRFCKDEINSIDEIIFFTQPEHSVHSFERIKKRLDFIGNLMKDFRGFGVKLGIDVLCTVGHGFEHFDTSLSDYDFYKDEAGEKNPGRLCPTSEKTKEYIHQVYSYAASIGPDTIHIDDDLHYAVDCYCERCEEIFAQKYNSGEKERTKYTKDRLCEIFRIIEEAIHSVDHKITVGWMTCRYGNDGIDYTDYAKALKGKKEEVVWRPGGGVYNDESMSALIKKVHSTGRQVSALPPFAVERYSEIENFPYFTLDKSPDFMTFEALMYIAAGCNATAYNMMSMYSGELEDYIPFLKTFDDMNGFADVMVNNMENEKPCGIGKLLADDVKADEAIFGDDLYNLGLPPAYSVENSCVFVMSKQIAQRLQREQLFEVLKKGVMLDGEALEYLNDIGFGDYTGFSATVNEGDFLIEKTIDHPLNTKSGQLRDVHMFFGWVPPVYKIQKISDGAEYLTGLVDYNGDEKGFASGVFENTLGGRVYVSGYAPFSFRGNKNFDENLKRVFRYLSRDTLPAYIYSCHKVAIWSRGTGIAVANLTAGKARDVKISVLTEKEEITIYKKQGPDVVKEKITAVKKDGNYKIFELNDLDYQEVLLLTQE